MKRREFVCLATVLAGQGLPLGISRDEKFRFDFSSIHDLLKKVPLAEKNTATMMIKNLVYNMNYIFKQAAGKIDITTLKKLAEEADRKFYSENKLKASSYGYQSFTLDNLETMERNNRLKPGEFDTMLTTIKYYTNKFKTSKGKFEMLLPELLKEAELAAQKQKEAEARHGCAKVLSVIAAVVIVVVAVVVAAFTFGAAGALVALAVIAAAAIVGSAIAGPQNIDAIQGSITGADTGVAVRFNGENISDEKVKLPWIDFDKKMKCAFLSTVNAVTAIFFSSKPYPSYAIMGSVAVNIIAITGKIPGNEIYC